MKILQRERNQAFEKSLAERGRSYISPQSIRGIDLGNPFQFEIICNEVNCQNPDPETVSAIIPILDAEYEDDMKLLKNILEKKELAELHAAAKKKLQESNA